MNPRPGDEPPPWARGQPLRKPSHPLWRWLARTLAAVVLAAVFLSYLSPHLAVDLASRLWACF